MDNSKKKNILLGVLIVGVISMTVAFAALSTNLRLNGTANVAATRWNIHFKEWHKVTTITEVTNGGQTHTNTAQAPSESDLTKEDNTNVTKVSGVNVTLNQPGDTAKYTFQIINEGTIDAKLDNFTVTDTTNNSLVDYDVKCYTNYDSSTGTFSGDEITQNSVLQADQTIYCYMQVTYKDQSNSHTAGTNQIYNQGAVSTSLTAAWTWVQNGVSSNSGSGNNNQQSGGNEQAQTNPYETSFNGTYEYFDGDYGVVEMGSPSSDMPYYIRKDTTTNKKEACLYNDNNPICIEANKWSSSNVHYDETSNDYVAEGYIAGKIQEAKAKGGYCGFSDYDSIIELWCSFPWDNNGDTYHFSMLSNGLVQVDYDGNGYGCSIDSAGVDGCECYVDVYEGTRDMEYCEYIGS